MIHPAATVIVVRARADDGHPLVYLTQRHQGMRFLGGYIVFPGGNVDLSDRDPAWDAHVSGFDAAEASERLGLPAAEARTFWVAGLRELCEEAALVMARGPGASEALTAAERRRWQTALTGGETSFVSLIKAAGLSLALDRLYYMDRRIGPPGAAVRYDTRYFVAVLPASQEPAPCAREVTRAFWSAPAEAVAAWERQELLMVPPTVATLRTLAAFSNTEELLGAARAGQLVMQPFPPYF